MLRNIVYAVVIKPQSLELWSNVSRKQVITSLTSVPPECRCMKLEQSIMQREQKRYSYLDALPFWPITTFLKPTSKKEGLSIYTGRISKRNLSTYCRLEEMRGCATTECSLFTRAPLLTGPTAPPYSRHSQSRCWNCRGNISAWPMRGAEHHHLLMMQGRPARCTRRRKLLRQLLRYL